MPPLFNKVAVRLVVLVVPVFFKPKFMVTVSPESTTPLEQLSIARLRLFETITGADNAAPASRLIRLAPAGVPQPVHRS